MAKCPARFTDEEIKAVKSSWRKLTANGVGFVGELILHRFYQDIPEVRSMFHRIGIDENIPDSYDLVTLQKNEKFRDHAKRVATALSKVVNSMGDAEKIVEMSTELGKSHVKYKVKPEHFDALGRVVVRVLTEHLCLDAMDNTILAWTKVYGAVSETAKEQLR